MNRFEEPSQNSPESIKILIEQYHAKLDRFISFTRIALDKIDTLMAWNNGDEVDPDMKYFIFKMLEEAKKNINIENISAMTAKFEGSLKTLEKCVLLIDKGIDSVDSTLEELIGTSKDLATTSMTEITEYVNLISLHLEYLEKGIRVHIPNFTLKDVLGTEQTSEPPKATKTPNVASGIPTPKKDYEKEKKPTPDKFEVAITASSMRLDISSEVRQIMEKTGISIEPDKLILVKDNPPRELDLFSHGENLRIMLDKAGPTDIKMTIIEKEGRIVEYMIRNGCFDEGSRTER